MEWAALNFEKYSLFIDHTADTYGLAAAVVTAALAGETRQGSRVVRARTAMTIENEEVLCREIASIFRSALKNAQDPTHSTFWKKQLQPLVEPCCDGIEAKINEFRTEKIHTRIANFVEVYEAQWFCVELEEWQEWAGMLEIEWRHVEKFSFKDTTNAT
jgi:hypothetical protein